MLLYPVRLISLNGCIARYPLVDCCHFKQYGTAPFYRGEFTLQSAEYVSYSLVAVMFGLPAFVANKVLLPAFYSRQDTKTPVKIAVKAMLFNVAFNFIMVGVLYYFDVVSLHVGLALASVGSAWLQCFWLYRKLRGDQIITQSLISVMYLSKIMFSLALMAAVIMGLLGVMPEWHEIRWYYRFVNLFIIIGSSALVYFISMYLLKGFQAIKLSQSNN